MITLESKVNLGCGDRLIPGFTNVDSRKEVNPDLVCDIHQIHKHFEPSSVDLIYACHVLEHFKRKEISTVIGSWLKCLKVGGILRLSVPDFDQVVKYYLLTNNIEPLQTFLYGGHKYEEDFHFITFTFKSITKLLLACGFSEVRSYDWRRTEHSYIDDYSQAYLPSMDKVNGMLMSLNVEAIC